MPYGTKDPPVPALKIRRGRRSGVGGKGSGGVAVGAVRPQARGRDARGGGGSMFGEKVGKKSNVARVESPEARNRMRVKKKKNASSAKTTKKKKKRGAKKRQKSVVEQQ